MLSREYVVLGRELGTCVFEMIANECDQKGSTSPDICKVALLKLLFQPGLYGRI
ncbi:MAG: DUF5717 family protein [[Clostridium] scindens]